MKKKIVYIAHPIGGDVEGNVKKVQQIFRTLSLENKVIPFAPYLVAVSCLNDGNINERMIGISQNLDMFDRGFIDEIWLYGDKVSHGMTQEIGSAAKNGIPVVSKSEGTKGC